MEKNKFDSSKFTTQGHAEKVIKPWGYELHWAVTPDYTGKIIHLNKGMRVSLQYHDNKSESHLLISGRVKYFADDQNGEYTDFEMEFNKGYTIVPFQRHRFEALEDSDIIEVSTPEKGITFRIEDDYSRTNETEEIRKQPGRGWKS